jgi:Guanylylate cyclase
MKIKNQPNDTTCGPTSLHAVYKYYGDKITLKNVISQVTHFDEGGTLAVLLGCHALERGYNAKLYTYNLNIFDPTWFQEDVDLISKLREQYNYKKDKKLKTVSKAYIRFLEKGGKLRYDELTTSLLKKYFEQGIPILTGLSATYLYQSKRELTIKNNKLAYDDIRGYPMGHFVVLCGYDEEKKHVVIADPYTNHPFNSNYYSVKVNRLINSILLGIVTYDSIFLIIEPKNKK